MQVTIVADSNTTSQQFVALSNLFRELSGVPATATALPPSDPAELSEPEVVVVSAPAEEAKPAVTRRRRTKAEIEAEAAALAAAEVAANPVVVTEPEPGTAPVVEQPVVEPEDFEKVAAPVASGKTYTEAEAQQLATVVARTKGPQVVKDKIAELGAVRIGDLTADQLNELGTYLETQK